MAGKARLRRHFEELFSRSVNDHPGFGVFNGVAVGARLVVAPCRAPPTVRQPPQCEFFSRHTSFLGNFSRGAGVYGGGLPGGSTALQIFPTELRVRAAITPYVDFSATVGKGHALSLKNYSSEVLTAAPFCGLYQVAARTEIPSC